jgi:hypothetical protein
LFAYKTRARFYHPGFYLAVRLGWVFSIEGFMNDWQRCFEQLLIGLEIENREHFLANATPNTSLALGQAITLALKEKIAEALDELTDA